MKPMLNKKHTVCSAIVYSFLLSFFTVFGYSFYSNNRIQNFFQSSSVIFKNLIYIVFLTALLSFVVNYIYSHNFSISNSATIHYKKYYFPLFILFYFICWLPAFFAYYPGIWSYDINTQVAQISSGQYNTYHPPLQTFFLDLCIRLSGGNYALAVIIYSIVQMLLLAIVFSSFTVTLLKNNAPKWFTAICILFWGLNPVIAIFSIIPVKDVVCGIVLVLLTTTLTELSFHPKDCLSSKNYYFKFCAVCALFCLLRNNAIYAVIVAVPIIFILVKENRLRLLFYLTSPIISYFAIVKIIYPLLGIVSSSGAEIISVPLQQISNVVTNSSETLSSYDVEVISKFLPYDKISNLYNPRFADPILYEYNDSYGILVVLGEWLRLLPSHITEYINAFLALNTPQWYPLASAADPISGALYIETNVTYHITGAPFVNAGIAPNLLSFYEQIADYSLLDRLPSFLNPFSLSFAIWIMLFCVFKILGSHNAQNCVFLVIPFLFWATYLLCPVSNMRYIVPLVFIYPIMVYYSFLYPINNG